ncbi:uncharacterized protein LOC117344093 [Pecten maximus]|uniref:uncharacterized protein LOC117344093 n=1 Tax=Pecten maximus TaxID=6579 RepID=UPI001458E760|nr:uncharacterized protein LOC117344093 [Pecten maximus]
MTDPEQNILDFETYYVKLSTSAHSKIHCGLLCVVKLGTCSYYVYDVSTTTCYGRPNAAFVPYNPGLLTVVGTGTKMVDITHRQKEFRSCVLEEHGILVGNITCIHVMKEQMAQFKFESRCKGRLFEPRTASLSREYKLPMLERGIIEPNVPSWIGLRYDTTTETYNWLSDGTEAAFTDWCTGNCSTSPPQPDLPTIQQCIVTVYLGNTGPFGWWAKACHSGFDAICEVPFVELN